MKIGIIGGTGFYHLLDEMAEQNVSTEYGDVTLFTGKYGRNEIYFLPRHGKSHNTLAPFINYKANMMALHQLEIERILAVSAVGAIHPEIKVGSLSLLDQFVDLTTREKTYGRFSADITEPFCPDLQAVFAQAARNINEPLREGTKLICVEGPRYETRAEIQLFAQWGMDVVGMTNATEASLARELGMCYSVVTLATNPAPGLTDIAPSLKTHKAVSDSKKDTIKELFLEAIPLVSAEKSCSCRSAYERAVLAKVEK